MARPLTTAEITRQLADLPGWRYAEGALRRSVVAPDFASAIAIVDAVAQAAEEMDHHPDVDIRWRTVHFASSTHSAGAVTQLDVELAHRISAAASDHGVRVDDAVDPKPRLEVTIDCVDAAAMRTWWAAALRYVEHDDLIVDPDGNGPTLWFQEVEEPKTVKNRVHLDLHLSRHEAAAKRDLLLSMGGSLLDTQETLWVIADPEGNEMCVCVDE